MLAALKIARFSPTRIDPGMLRDVDFRLASCACVSTYHEETHSVKGNKGINNPGMLAKAPERRRKYNKKKKIKTRWKLYKNDK